ncbi:MAG TPA: hypothetical protein VFF04_01465 [Candidatus Babeliales bacterium]|nr:hypothetical protein [Candidatus Babeliales bacterium]
MNKFLYLLLGALITVSGIQAMDGGNCQLLAEAVGSIFPVKPEKLKLDMTDGEYPPDEVMQYQENIAINKAEWETYKDKLNRLNLSCDAESEQYIRNVNQLLESLECCINQPAIQEAYTKKYLQRSKLQNLRDLLTTIQYIPTVIPHELGHAFAAKILHDQPFNVHIGAMGSEVPNSMLAVGKKLTVHSYDFSKGFNTFKRESIPVSVAGPLAGMAANLYIMKKALSNVTHPKLAIQIISILTAHISIKKLINEVRQLTPMGGVDSDGQKIWRQLGLSEHHLSKARAAAPVLYFIASCCGDIYVTKQVYSRLLTKYVEKT